MSETTEAVRKMSAALLARGTGLGSQEIHWLLHRAGLLDGQPGAWSPTEKALSYVGEEFRQRGTGGYGFMNPSWEWLTWDPKVLDLLDLSDAGKQWARQAVKDWRLGRPARETAAAAAERVLPAAENAAAAARGADPAKVMLGVLVLAGAGAAAYGLTKAVPLVRRRWQQRAGAAERAGERDER